MDEGSGEELRPAWALPACSAATVGLGDGQLQEILQGGSAARLGRWGRREKLSRASRPPPASPDSPVSPRLAAGA